MNWTIRKYATRPYGLYHQHKDYFCTVNEHSICPLCNEVSPDEILLQLSLLDNQDSNYASTTILLKTNDINTNKVLSYYPKHQTIELAQTNIEGPDREAIIELLEEYGHKIK